MSNPAHRGRALALVVAFILTLAIVFLALAVHPTAGHARTAAPITANLKCPAPGTTI